MRRHPSVRDTECLTERRVRASQPPAYTATIDVYESESADNSPCAPREIDCYTPVLPLNCRCQQGVNIQYRRCGISGDF
jgi:hypothetical protein